MSREAAEVTCSRMGSRSFTWNAAKARLGKQQNSNEAGAQDTEHKKGGIYEPMGHSAGGGTARGGQNSQNCPSGSDLTTA